MNHEAIRRGRSDLDSTHSIVRRLDAYLECAHGAYSANTERAIRGDLRRFIVWCVRNGLEGLPASAATLVAYIESEVCDHAPATVRRYVSSISTVHKALGFVNPLDHKDVKLALKRMHRRNGRRQKQALGLTWSLCEQLLSVEGDRLIDLRNKALLAVAYDILARRSELVELEVNDLVINADGSGTLLVRRGKTDPEGVGALQYMHADTVRTVRAWVQESQIVSGPLFRAVRKDGVVGGQLDATQIPRIYKHMARKAMLPEEVVNQLSGHSPRVGGVQDMIALGISAPAIQQSGRWKSASMVNRYGEHLLAQRSGSAQLARLLDRK